MFRLPPLRVNFLAEIAGVTYQTDRHHRQFKVGSRTQGIAGEHTQPSGVGRDFIAQRNLHREVRMRGSWIIHRA